MTDAQTFRAPSTQAAFEMIQEALGPDAMIVSVRQLPSGAPWEAFQKRPEVEVLAIPGNTPPALSEPALRLPASRPSSKPASLPTGSAGKNGAELAAFLMKLASSDAKAELPKPLASISTHLIRQGVDAAIVKRVTAACKKALTPVILQDEARLRAFVRKYLEAYVHTARTDVISKDGSTY